MTRFAHLFFLLLSLTSSLLSPTSAHKHHESKTPYNIGDPVPIQCLKRDIRNANVVVIDKELGEFVWEPAPVCTETGRPLQITYGVDEFRQCTWILTADLYELMRAYVDHQAPYHCRVPLAANSTEHHAPLALSFLGAAERNRVRVATGVNVVVHMKRAEGEVVGATGYSVPDQFVKVNTGDTLLLHFSIHWYRGSTLTNPIASRTALLGAARNPSLLVVFVACALTWLGTVAACIAFYRLVMRPGDAKVAMMLGRKERGPRGPVEGVFKKFS